MVESPINVIPNEINPLGQDGWEVRTRPSLAGARLAQRFAGAQVQSIPSSADTLVLLIEGSSDNPLAIEAELAANPDIKWFEQQIPMPIVLRGGGPTITDPLFPNQWHLINSGQFAGIPGIDANVQGPWSEGVLGSGVVIGIVDDGLTRGHPDLAPNYRADLSYDYVSNDPDPSPGGHGSAVAGVAAARDDGSACRRRARVAPRRCRQGHWSKQV